MESRNIPGNQGKQDQSRMGDIHDEIPILIPNTHIPITNLMMIGSMTNNRTNQDIYKGKNRTKKKDQICFERKS